ncbi:MAG: D-alanine--D-alanine ligase [Candidatus Doudnabacteria bacterium]|nr:D-alanine--D-alanine ligase [Candidatus Doudnabacteria bacterium]
MTKKLRIALFFGGTSKEREVSLISGKSVAEKLDPEKYDVTPVEVKVDGSWDLPKDTDVAFLALHGPGGEDGTVQHKLDELKIPYTFSGATASALAMDKNKTKQIVAKNGVLVAPQVEINKNDYEKDPESFLKQISGTVVIKPNRIGSSYGVTISDSPDEIKIAIDKAFEHGDDILIEKYIAGKEFTVPVMGNKKLSALPVIEIVPKNGSKFFDFKAKYEEEFRDEIVPARILPELTLQLQNEAIKIHKLIGCRGVSRSDFIVTDTDKEIYFLEINTIPGMTGASLVPKSAAAAGMSYSQFLDKVIDLALDKE